MRFSLFWDVTLRKLVVTDVSGQPTGPPSWTALPLKKGPIGCPKTSLTTKPRFVNIPEEQRPRLHCGGNLKSCTYLYIMYIFWSKNV